MNPPAIAPDWGRELLISRRAREEYGIERLPADGADLFALRLLAQRVNRRRAAAQPPEPPLAAGQLNALRLLERLLHRLVGVYRERHGDETFDRAFEWLEQRFGAAEVERLLETFVDLYPPDEVFTGLVGVETWLAAGPETRRAVLERLLVLWLINHNPAAARLAALFADDELEAAAGYRRMIASLRGFFARQPPLSDDGGNFFELLLAPLRERPESLAAQLELLVELAAPELVAEAASDVDLALDVLREEEKPIFVGPGGGPPGPGPIEVPDYVDLSEEEERFSEDRDWMPEVVLVAKNALVWLDQLSRAEGRPIRRLDEIPDAELARLARWGFNALWLIGLWQRSAASRRIKQLCGNPEAAASAYSLEDYRVADELGGESALAVLERRAARHGLRLACDMVPNHMGIDSRWVRERPELFLSLPHKPFPGYTFGGPDLSSDPRVAIHLEDHYYDKSDAAVVFRRTDTRSGATRYVYHGNDGTSMPWNDTAQLDYLDPAVREAVIEVILEVAKRFPIIRFDAAMTLARRHVQRLWYPEPGQGGAIPSRAEHGMPREEFLRRMPEEFWRQVVDRVAAEAPDTLLLAEAFWLMEGYFVRTLGMHRVYNSAFMHMLRDEDNDAFRETLVNTLEFDPEVLKRFVNYVTNPDEKSAAEQLGTGDKYFGVCTVMATLPGLPMFGHGQFEGLREKYGMEYRRAYSAELPDARVVERHEREIVPLLARRHLFAGVERFRLYEVEGPGGGRYPHLLAYSNGRGADRVLVLYHNRPHAIRCRLRVSVPWRAGGEGEATGLRRESLARALGAEADPDLFLRLRDAVGGLEYLVSAQELATRGLTVELGAYERRVLLVGERLRDDEERRFGELAAVLGHGGVPDLEAALEELAVRPVQTLVGSLLDGALLERLIAARAAAAAERAALLDEVEKRARELLATIRPLLAQRAAGEPDAAHGQPARLVAAEQRRALAAVLDLDRAPQDPDPASGLENAERGAAEPGQTGTDRRLPDDVAVKAGIDSPLPNVIPAKAGIDPTLSDPNRSANAGIQGGGKSPGEWAAQKDATGEPGEGAERSAASRALVEPLAIRARSAAGEPQQAETPFSAEPGEPAEQAAQGRPSAEPSPGAAPTERSSTEPSRERLAGLLCWALFRPLGRLLGERDAAARGRALVDVWMLDAVAERALRAAGLEEEEARGHAAATKLFVALQGWWRLGAEAHAAELVTAWLDDAEIARFLGVNEHAGVRWFNREGYRLFVRWLRDTAAVGQALAAELQGAEREPAAAAQSLAACLEAAEAPSGYRVDALLESLEDAPAPGRGDDAGRERGAAGETTRSVPPPAPPEETESG